MMAEHPAALQLRLLQTVVEVAAEKNSTLVLPFPVELLRFLEKATPAEPVTNPATTRAPGEAEQQDRATTTGTPATGAPATAAAGTPALTPVSTVPMVSRVASVPLQPDPRAVRDAVGMLPGQCG